MALACKLCIAERGLRGSEIKDLPQTQEEFNEHIEKVHHMPIVMPGETREQAIERFLKKYPEAKTCPKCIADGAPWTK